MNLRSHLLFLQSQQSWEEIQKTANILNSDINSLSVRSKLFGSYLLLVELFCRLVCEHFQEKDCYRKLTLWSSNEWIGCDAALVTVRYKEEIWKIVGNGFKSLKGQVDFLSGNIDWTKGGRNVKARQQKAKVDWEATGHGAIVWTAFEMQGKTIDVERYEEKLATMTAIRLFF